MILVGHQWAVRRFLWWRARRRCSIWFIYAPWSPGWGTALENKRVREPTMLSEGWDSALSPDGEGRTVWTGKERTKELSTPTGDDSTVFNAIAGLRPQTNYPLRFPFPLEEFPPVPTTSVVCRDDQMVGNDWSRAVAGTDSVPHSWKCRAVIHRFSPVPPSWPKFSSPWPDRGNRPRSRSLAMSTTQDSMLGTGLGVCGGGVRGELHRPGPWSVTTR